MIPHEGPLDPSQAITVELMDPILDPRGPTPRTLDAPFWTWFSMHLSPEPTGSGCETLWTPPRIYTWFPGPCGPMIRPCSHLSGLPFDPTHPWTPWNPPQASLWIPRHPDHTPNPPLDPWTPGPWISSHLSGHW